MFGAEKLAHDVDIGMRLFSQRFDGLILRLQLAIGFLRRLLLCHGEDSRLGR